MANPQKEEGFTAIANEIMDQLALLYLSSSEWKMIMVLFRQTYGWNKKTDVISLSQFEKKTGMDRTTVCRMKKRLVAKRLLVVLKNGLMFNKNYEEWVVAKQPVAKHTRPSGETDYLGSGETLNQVVAKQPHTKDTIQKTLITKETNTKDILKAIEKPKRNGQLLVEYFFSLKGWQNKSKKELYAVFPRYIKTAEQIMELVENDLETAKHKVRRLQIWADNNSLDWSLETVIKRWMDIEELPQEKKQKAYVGNDRAYKKGDDWWLILPNGEHKRFAGSLNELRYE